MNQQQQRAIAAIQQSFNDVVAQTKLKPAEVCRELLNGTISKPDKVDFSACQVVPQGEFVNVTFSTPIAPSIFSVLKTI